MATRRTCGTGMRGGAHLRPRCTEHADQRSGRDVPISDLFEVVRRVQQAAPQRSDQLSVNRIGRRHPAGHEPDGLLRRHRRPHDRRAAEGRTVEDPPLPHGARRRGSRIQRPERDRRTEVHGSRPRRHLPGEDHQMERPRAREAEPRGHSPSDEPYRGPSVRRVGNDVHLGRLPLENLARMAEKGRRRNLGQLASRDRRQGE